MRGSANMGLKNTFKLLLWPSLNGVTERKAEIVILGCVFNLLPLPISDSLSPLTFFQIRMGQRIGLIHLIAP